MVGSALGMLVVVGLVVLILGFMNPSIPLVIAVLAGLPLGLRLVAGASSRFAPSASSASGGPRVPNTTEASYDPAATPTTGRSGRHRTPGPHAATPAAVSSALQSSPFRP